MHRYQSMWRCTSCRKSQTFFSLVQCHRWLIPSPFLSFFFFFFILTCSFFLISFILPESNKSQCWAVWLFKALLPSSQRISLKVPTWVYHSYKRKSLLIFFCLWLIYTFFKFGVLFCIIFTYYDNQSYILWKIKTTHRYNIQLSTYS